MRGPRRSVMRGTAGWCSILPGALIRLPALLNVLRRRLGALVRVPVLLHVCRRRLAITGRRIRVVVVMVVVQPGVNVMIVVLAIDVRILNARPTIAVVLLVEVI